MTVDTSTQLLPALEIVFGVVVLTFGADALVRGAAGLARRLGMSQLAVGLTVVAFGTSTPELFVSLGAALSGNGSVALGNAVGSNIFNVLLILGASAAISPLLVRRQLVRLDVPVMVATALLVLVLSLDGALDVAEGILLLSLLVVYLTVLLRLGKHTEPDAPSGAGAAKAGRGHPSAIPAQIGWVLLGLTLLIVGAHFLVTGAEAVARSLGISDLIIGLTVVAAGTSLPELATSVVAAIKGQRDIAVGNVVGSCIFNMLAVLGAAAVAAGRGGLEVPLGVITFDMPVMLAVSFACLPIFFTGWTITRWEGWVFLAYYVIYVVYLFLSHTHHAAESAVRTMMLFFALPLTAITLSILVAQEFRSRRGAPQGG